MTLDDLLHDKRRLFWVLQFIGWSGWAMSFYLGVLVGGEPPENYSWYLPVVAAIGMVITLGLRWLYQRTWDATIGRRAFVILAGSWCAGAAWMVCRATIFFNAFPAERAAQLEEKSRFLAHFNGSVSAFWVMLVWSALYVGIKYYLLAQEEKQRSLKAMSMAQEAQLKMLRYQLNPHFLFNTLNAISTLILDQDTKLANDMVMRLSRFLRYSLDNDPMQRVTVAEEVEALRLYLAIEQVRFGDRLTLHFNIDRDAADALIPSLLLQPIVENAIKYAIAQSVGGGSIGVSASMAGGQLRLQVADDGPGLDLRNGRMPKGGGVGLVNIRERLKQLYGERQSFRLSTTEPHGLTITITLPIERASAGERKP
ncbi:MAG TPA: histidine kinase [Pseudohaliea sp.]|nr:histidine kinase [Pseudohaliea sp.]